MIERDFRLARVALQLEAELRIGAVIRERAERARALEDAAFAAAVKGT